MAIPYVLDRQVEEPERPSTPAEAFVGRLTAGIGRRVTLLAVHHVKVGDQHYHGGAEKYILATLRALLGAGAGVHVGYSGTSIYHDLLLEADPSLLTVERTGWLNEDLSGDARLTSRTILARRKWLRATRTDTLLAVQQAGGSAFGASLVAARTLGLRVVSSIRQLPQDLPCPTGKRFFGIIPSPELWRRRLIWRRRLPAYCCNVIIYNSLRVAQAYARQYGFPPRRARIIHNGETSRRRRCALRSSAPREIASVGRVTKAKGADVLLDAFAAVAARHPETRLTYYGDGPLIPVLRAKALAIGLEDRVRFTGYRDDHEAIFPNIDIYVQPSRRESMSNSVIEAMARGIPCVVTDVGGLPETVADGRAGFVVGVDRPRDCAEAISTLLSNRDTFARHSSAALARVRNHFDADHVMRQTVETVLGT